MESTVINNTTLIQIAILAWLFLGEALSGQEILGMVVAGVGVLLVQLKSKYPQILDIWYWILYI